MGQVPFLHIIKPKEGEDEMKRLVIALAELDLTIDEWLCFKMKELILANRLSKENRGEE